MTPKISIYKQIKDSRNHFNLTARRVGKSYSSILGSLQYCEHHPNIYIKMYCGSSGTKDYLMDLAKTLVTEYKIDCKTISKFLGVVNFNNNSKFEICTIEKSKQGEKNPIKVIFDDPQDCFESERTISYYVDRNVPIIVNYTPVFSEATKSYFYLYYIFSGEKVCNWNLHKFGLKKVLVSENDLKVWKKQLGDKKYKQVIGELIDS